MPKQKKGAKKAKAKEVGKKTKDPFIVCPFTEEKVYIRNVTLPEITKARKTGECPSYGSNKKVLVRIPSVKVREEILQQSARAVALKEQEAMPLYGGRPWRVSCKFAEPNTAGLKSPLFRWFRGALELACLPHYLEKIPNDGPKKQRGRTMMDDEEDRELLEDYKATNLQERSVSALSTVAWNDRTHKIPLLTTKWLSPLGERFSSRKAAWEHANALTEQQVFMDKILRGYGARGQKLKPTKPSKPQALKAGKLRFLRDGLWIVGQEESWQAQRTKELLQEMKQEQQRQQQQEEEKQAMQQIGAECESIEGQLGCPAEGGGDANDKDPPKKRPLSALQYFIRCKRVDFRDKRLEELKAAAAETSDNDDTSLTEEPRAGSKVDRLEAAAASSVVPTFATTDSNENAAVESAAPPSGSILPLRNAHPTRAAAAGTASLQATCSSQPKPVEKQGAVASLVSNALLKYAASTGAAAAATNPELMSRTGTEPIQSKPGAKEPVTFPTVSTETATALYQSSLQSHLAASHNVTATAARTEATCAPIVSMNTSAPGVAPPTGPRKKEKIRYTLADADKELRGVWKTLDSDQQAHWAVKAKEYEKKREQEGFVDEAAPDKQKVTRRRLSPQEFYIRTRRETYRDDKLAELKEASGQNEPARFTLTEAANELKNVWKALSNQEKKEWKERAQREQTIISNAAGETKNVGVLKTGVVTPASSDTELEGSKESTDMPSSGSATLAFGVDQHSRDEATVVSNKPILDKKEASSVTHAHSAAIRVSPTPQLDHVQTDETQGDAQETRVVKRKRASGALRKITPSFHWRMSSAAIDMCYDAAMDHYRKVMHTVKARALHSELADGFDVLRERGRGRYDMELPIFDTPAFSFLTDIDSASWMPIVREILGQDVILIHKGVFLSMPGAEAQVYHQDGPHLTEKYQRPCHAVNVFVPLVDLTSRNGPTEFCLGTHILGHENFVKERAETCLVPAGTPVIFDYRLGHRGLGNSSSFCRPIVYCTYSAKANGKEFRDSVNFSRRRYHKIGDLCDMPLSREERAKKRRLSQEAAKAEQQED